LAYPIGLPKPRLNSLPELHLSVLPEPYLIASAALYVHIRLYLIRFFSRSDFLLGLTRSYPAELSYSIRLLPTRSYLTTLLDFLTRSDYPLMHTPSNRHPLCHILLCNKGSLVPAPTTPTPTVLHPPGELFGPSPRRPILCSVPSGAVHSPHMEEQPSCGLRLSW
jgi:hypothetical protein